MHGRVEQQVRASASLFQVGWGGVTRRESEQLIVGKLWKAWVGGRDGELWRFLGSDRALHFVSSGITQAILIRTASPEGNTGG